MDPDSSRLMVTVTDGRGRPVRDEGLARWMASVVPARVRGEVAVALAPDSQVRALNRRFRKQDAATDVLSFPSGNATTFLGDIVIATGVAKRQARAIGHPYRTELRVLALHGLLHLLGYDHEDHRDGGRMSRVEAQLRRKGGLPSTLIERTEAQDGRKNPSDRRRRKRLRPERPFDAAQGRREPVERRGAKSVSESERGWGPASAKR